MSTNQPLSFELDAGAAGDAALGLIVLASDETIEPELAPLFAEPGVALYHSRIPSAAEVTNDTLAEMEAALPRAVALLPAAAEFSAIGYACTSGATVIGPEKIAGIINAAHPNAKASDPMSALIAAARHLGAVKIGFVTPYIAEVSQAMRDYLEQNGFEIAAFGSFEQGTEKTVARISEPSLKRAMIDVAGGAEVDLLFASCTNLRAFSVIEQVERATGVAVISSNLALAWHLRRLAGLPTAGKGPGLLFNS